MRIAIDARMYGAEVTGLGVYVQGLISALTATGGRPEYVVLVRPEQRHRLTVAHPHLRVVTADVPWYGWSEQLVLPSLLKRLRCDLVHFPNFNVPIAYRRPFVVTIHDLTPLDFPGHHQSRSRLHRLAYRWVLRHALRASRRIIAVSEHTRRALISWLPAAAGKITVIYPGLSPSFLTPPGRGMLRHHVVRAGVNRSYLFYTGVWREHKNLVGLLSAFRQLRQDYRHDLQLVLGGERRNADPRISARLDEFPAGLVVTPGFIPQAELTAFYRWAELTVIPSFREGFGLVAIESLACGTPVVASRGTAVPEILGPAGLYFDPHQPVEMARVIHQALQPDTRSRLIAAAAEVLTRYRWERAAQQTLTVYEAAGRR